MIGNPCCPGQVTPTSDVASWKFFSSSAEAVTTLMPRPPPPMAALMITGYLGQGQGKGLVSRSEFDRDKDYVLALTITGHLGQGQVRGWFRGLGLMGTRITYLPCFTATRGSGGRDGEKVEKKQGGERHVNKTREGTQKKPGSPPPPKTSQSLRELDHQGTAFFGL